MRHFEYYNIYDINLDIMIFMDLIMEKYFMLYKICGNGVSDLGEYID